MIKGLYLSLKYNFKNRTFWKAFVGMFAICVLSWFYAAIHTIADANDWFFDKLIDWLDS